VPLIVPSFYAASMVLFSLLNRILDLGSKMAIANDMGKPTRYPEISSFFRKMEQSMKSLRKR